MNAGQPYAGISPQNAKATQAATEAQLRYENSKNKGFFDQLKQALPVISLGLPVIGPTIGASISGALQGTSLGNAFEAITSALGKLPAPVSGSLKGAAMSGITGGDPLKGALTGGIGGLRGMVAGSMGFDPQIGSTIAKQGLGMYRQNQAQEGYKRAMQQWQLAQMARRSPFPQRTV